MPKHRQPTPTARRTRPAVVTLSTLALLSTATSVAWAATNTAPGAATTPAATAVAATQSIGAPPEPTTATATSLEESATTTTETPGTSSPLSDSGSWLSGASGEGAADGALGEWRGDPVDIVGTWADVGDNQTQLWSIAPGGEVADFDGAIDIAPGGLQDGDTWAAAADGAYDDRWRESLTRMAELRDGKGTTYVRPFHEFNLGGAYPWAVTPGQAGDFTTAWKRYRAIQQDVFPEARLVYGVNVTSSGTDLDWRTTWPGSGQADVLGVDTYNGWPTITSATEFEAQLDARGDGGIPIGLNAYSEQAEDWGVPLAVPEWSGRAEMGDESAYVTGMVDWFAEHAGNGPGQLIYEILFNAPQDERNFQLFTDDSRMPASAEAYVDAVQATAGGQGSDAPSGGADASTEPGDATIEQKGATSWTSSPSEKVEPATADPTSPPAAPVDQADVDALVARLDELLDRLERA